MKTLLLVAVGLASMRFISGQTLDITGISLGSAYNEAVSSLAGKGFRTTSIQMPPDWQRMAGTVAHKEEAVVFGHPKNRYWEGYIVQAIDGKVVYVAHEVSYGDNPKPNDQETVDSLKAKYGKSVTLENNPQILHEAGSYIFDWTFNASGKVVSEYGPDRLSCGVGGPPLQGNAPTGNMGGIVTNVGTGISCSKWASARLYGDPRNGQLVNSMDVRIADVATLKAFFTQQHKLQQNKLNSQGEAGKRVKAPM